MKRNLIAFILAFVGLLCTTPTFAVPAGGNFPGAHVKAAAPWTSTLPSTVGCFTAVTVASGGNCTIAAGAAGTTNYLTGLTISCTGATAVGTAIITLTNLLACNDVYDVGLPALATGAETITRDFSFPIQASASATSIIATLSGGAANNGTCNITLHGIQF